MSIYDDSNIVPFDAASTARQVHDRMAASDYVSRKLDELAEETGALDLDDATSRQIVKYQARMAVQAMFEKISLALSSITEEEILATSVKDRSSMVVGLTGRIDTLMTLIQKISDQDGSEMDQFIIQLRQMPRDEAIIQLRKEFMALFQTLFTDEERETVFQDIESQVALDKLGVSSDDDNVRSNSDGAEAGSSRWVPKRGPAGILPPSRPS